MQNDRKGVMSLRLFRNEARYNKAVERWSSVMVDKINADKNENSLNEDKNFDHDGFWKNLINRFCYSLLKRAVPELYEKADITKAHRQLDKEFTDILNTGKRKLHISPHFADFLFEIPLKDGSVEWILFHAEAQGPKGGIITKRMNRYRSFINAHYDREPVALAIITDGHKKEERFYSHAHFGTEITYRYNNLVLADLDDDELQASENPIDLALFAAKCALRAKEEFQRYNYLRKLLGLLGERGWSKDDKRDILLFLERIIDLQDEELEKKYVEYRNQLNREGKIVYIPLGERELAKEIKQSGIVEGKEEMVINLLAKGVSPDIIAQSAGWPIERVQTLVN
jgi:ribosomal protein S6